MNKRQPGVDLMRCLGLFFVVGVHFFLYNGFYFEPQTRIILWPANATRWLFYGCNGIFMLMTGYLKSVKPLNLRYYRSLLSVLVSYILTCLITFPVRHFVLGEKHTLLQWCEKMIIFDNYAWYIEVYIGLLVFSPIINLAVKHVQSNTQLIWLGASILVLTTFPSITSYNLIPDYWTGLFPMNYYILGAIIRRMQPKIKPWLCLLGACLVAAGLGLTTLVTTDSGFDSGYTQGYGGFWITIMVVFLFLAVYQLRIPAQIEKILAWMAGGCFEGYILSRLLDVWIYDQFPQWHTPKMYPLLFVCATLPIFCISLLAGKGVSCITNQIMKIKFKKPVKV